MASSLGDEMSLSDQLNVTETFLKGLPKGIVRETLSSKVLELRSLISDATKKTSSDTEDPIIKKLVELNPTLHEPSDVLCLVLHLLFLEQGMLSHQSFK